MRLENKKIIYVADKNQLFIHRELLKKTKNMKEMGLVIWVQILVKAVCISFWTWEQYNRDTIKSFPFEN